MAHRGNYRKAFLACRKHRIDLNILIDHDPEAFMRRLSDFVEQIHEVDYINLFLSGVGSVQSVSPYTHLGYPDTNAPLAAHRNLPRKFVSFATPFANNLKKRISRNM